MGRDAFLKGEWKYPGFWHWCLPNTLKRAVIRATMQYINKAFLFTAAASTVLVGDIIFPKTWSTAVNVGNREAVVHVVDCRGSLKLVLQSVCLPTEKLSDPISCLEFRNIGRIKKIVTVLINSVSKYLMVLSFPPSPQAVTLTGNFPLASEGLGSEQCRIQ